MADPENPQASGPDNSGQKERKKCRHCGVERKPDVEWIAPDYCSGICMRADGLRPPLVGKPTKIEDKPADRKATLEDYQFHSEDYRRRLDPERLNWGAPLDVVHLKQAGLRANRIPIPGDWDYVGEEKEEKKEIVKEVSSG